MRSFWFLLLLSILSVTAQAQKYPRGIPMEKDSLYEEIPQKAPLTQELYRNVGSAASLKSFAPTPGNQGAYGTCAAYACAYSARTIAEARYHNWTDRNQITQHAFSPGFIYRISEPNNYKCWGAYTSEILANIERYGVPKLDDYPYSCPNAYPGSSSFSKASPYKIKGFVKLFGSSSSAKPKVQSVKMSISQGNPVVISMICPDSFDDANGVWRPTEQPDDPTWGRQHGRHAMCVVGYDDHKYGGAFEILNSWGTGWGNQGYIWITYDDFADFVYQAYELLPLAAPKPIAGPTHLKGSVRFVENSGTEMPVSLKGSTYVFKQAYTAGTRFRIYINNEKPAYVYAFGSDLSEALFPIFPPEPGISPALTYTKNEVALPSEEQHIRLDGNVGTDYICLIYSRDPLDINSIKAQVRSGSGSFQQKVQAALASSRMPAEQLQLQPNAIAFEAKSPDKSVALLFLELQHQ